MISEKTNTLTGASRFLANTLHEIRTPIQTIIGTIELIQETNLDKEQTEYIRQIQFSAEVLLDLANNILDFTKIRSNEFKLESIPFDIAMVTEQVVDLISIESFNKGVEIVTDIETNVPSLVNGDPIRLQQIILNLVKNAVKFTNSGYIHIELSYKNGNINFQITDSGIGISEEKQKKLFSDYFQADISTYRKFGGTGLGLSICKNLVKMMNGTIGVKSNPYGGAIFYFSIPMTEAVESGFEIKKKNILDNIPENTKILIVDDNVLAKKSLARKLFNLGIKDVDFASSAEEALVQIQFSQKISKPFTSILINLTLPTIDGWQLASKLKNNPEIDNTFKLYLIVPEGQMRGEAKMKLLDWFDGYIYKPVKRNKLIELIESSFEKEKDLKKIKEIEESKEQIEIKEKEKSIANGKKILIAEDHPVNRKLIEAFLKSFGAEVYIAEDGFQVIEQIKKNPDIALIFMDIFMPNKSGVEATEELRKQGYNGIIVACTANNDSNDFADYMKIGINDILVKPFKKSAIKSTIEKWNAVMQIPMITGVNLIETLNPVAESIEKDDTEIWNVKEFLESTDSDKAFGKKLVIDFILQTEKLLNAIDSNLRITLESDIIHKQAHTIKGSAASIYADAIFNAAKEIDEQAKKATSIQATARLSTKKLHERFDEFRKYAKSIVKDWD